MPDLRIHSLAVAIGLSTIATAPAAAQTLDRIALPSIVAPAAAEAPAASGRADGPAEPPQAFWQALGDTTLDRLVEQALRGNRRLQAASARVDAAGASRLGATLDMVPSVTASAGYTRRRLASSAFPGIGAATLPDEDLWESGLNASWEVDVFGRLRGGLRARNDLLGAAGEDVRDAQISTAAAVAQSYFDLRGAQDRLAVARRNAENQRHTLELTQSRLDAGRGTELDTERARAQLSSTLAAIPTLEAAVAASRYRLAVLTGRPPSALAGELAGTGELPDLPDSVPEMDASEVLRTRPDVLGAERRVAATRALSSSARAGYLPRISLAAAAGYTASAVDNFGNQGTFNYAFGPVVSWSAFDIGHVKARVDEAQAQEREASADYEQAVLVAQEELESATVAYRASRERLEHLEDAAAASERAAALARMRYEGGIADFLQVLDAERTLLAAQDQLAQSRTDAANAYVALYRARGASWGGKEAERR